MKHINLADINKIVRSLLAELIPTFQKHGDKLLFALALAVLATALFRLGGGKAISHAVAPSIVFTQWWEDDPGKDALLKLIKEFESLHGGIKIVLNTRSYEDLRSGLFSPDYTSPGDILALDPLWVPELIKREIIENSRQEAYKTPFLSFISVLYYNVEILREAGYIRPPKSRGEFLNCARALAGREENRPGFAPDKVYGLAMDGNSSRGVYDDVYPWIWAAGAQLIKDGKPAADSRPIAESLSFLATLNSEGLIHPGTEASGNAGEKMENFVTGRAAFMIAPAGYIRLVKERMGDGAFGISSVPTPDNFAGKLLYGTAGWTVAVNPASAHKEEARLFVSFLAEKAPFLSDETKAIPGIDTPPATDLLYSKAWDIVIAGEAAQDFSRLTGEHELEQIFREELSALFEGQYSPAEAAAAIQKRWVEVHKP